MVEIIISFTTLAASGLVLWRINRVQRKVAQSVVQAQSAQNEAEKFAAKSERAAVSARSHSMSALAHVKRAETFADKSEASASKAGEQSGMFRELLTKIDSSTPKPRTRGEVYDQVQAEVAAKQAEAQPLIDLQNRIHRFPHWLARWSPTPENSTKS